MLFSSETLLLFLVKAKLYTNLLPNPPNQRWIKKTYHFIAYLVRWLKKFDSDLYVIWPYTRVITICIITKSSTSFKCALLSPNFTIYNQIDVISFEMQFQFSDIKIWKWSIFWHWRPPTHRYVMSWIFWHAAPCLTI